MNRSLRYIAGLFVCLLTSSLAQGQIVRIGVGGGVRVRAPFVGVDVLPYRGGTRVRAPFTSVRTGAYRYGYAPYYRRPYVAYPDPVYVQPYYYPQPVYVEPVGVDPVVVQPVAEPEYRSARSGQVNRNLDNGAIADAGSGSALVDRLVVAAQQLRRSLESRRDDADVWLDYLQPQEIIARVQAGNAPESLAALLNNYEGVTGNSSLASIWSAAGFRETYDLLGRYVGAAGNSATKSIRPVERLPEPMEPKVAKPIDSGGNDTNSKAAAETDDEQNGEESILLPPKNL